MNSKVLIGGIIGGIAFFLLGYLFYGLLLGKTMSACMTCQRPMEELNFIVLFIGNVFVGLTLSYILNRFAGVGSFSKGAVAGATIGGLFAIGWASISYATSEVYSDTSCMIYQILVEVIMWGVVGGVIGWWLGRRGGLKI